MDFGSGPIRPKKLKLSHVSATQVDTYRNTCKRKWYLGWPCGFKTPETRAMRLGTAYHACLENYMKTGELVPNEEFPEVLEMAQSTLPFLPPPATDKNFPEQDLKMHCYEDGPVWVGFIDLLESDVKEVQEKLIGRVTDYKSRSDHKWNKTKEELQVDTQLGSYAKWAFDNSDYVYLELQHLNTNTRGRKRTVPVSIIVNREWADQIWKRDMETVREMDELLALGLDAMQVEPTGVQNDACGKYGGCEFRTLCGTVSATKSYGVSIEMAQPNTMDALMKMRDAAIKAKEARALPAAEPAALEIKAPAEDVIPPAVLPPDAPSRTSTPEEIAEANGETFGVDEEIKALDTGEAPKKRGRKPKVAEAAPAPEVWKITADELATPEEVFHITAEEIAPTPEPEAPKAPEPEIVTSFVEAPKNDTISCRVKTIYVDCLPEKGVHQIGTIGDHFTMLAEYAAAAYNHANPMKQIADYRLIDYKAAGYLALAVRMNLDVFPETLYIDSRASGATVILEELTKFAQVVVRGTR